MLQSPWTIWGSVCSGGAFPRVTVIEVVAINSSPEPETQSLLAVGAGKCRVPTVGRVVEGIPQGASTASPNKRCCLFLGPKCLRRAEKPQDVAKCQGMVSHY